VSETPAQLQQGSQQASARARRAPRADPRTAIRTAAVWQVLDDLALRPAGDASGSATGSVAGEPARVLDVLDVGGGTGGFAVPLAALGHRVTVVDPSPDALAALQRRAAEAGVNNRITPLQGDAGELAQLVGAGSADLVLCHGVLEYTDDPAKALADAVAVLRPAGLLSLLVHSRFGGVLARALSGRFGEAQAILSGPEGSSGTADPFPRRFDLPVVLELLAGQDLDVRAVHGVRLFADLLPGALVDGDPTAVAALLELERAAGDHSRFPELAAVAAQLHVVATARD